MGKIIPDDKDHMGNNRIITAGHYWLNYLKVLIKNIETIKYGIVKEYNKSLKDEDLQDLLYV